jgi:hypothetical protein
MLGKMQRSKLTQRRSQEIVTWVEERIRNVPAEIVWTERKVSAKASAKADSTCAPELLPHTTGPAMKSLVQTFRRGAAASGYRSARAV